MLRPGHPAGFTLIELVLLLALFALLSALAVPSFSRAIARTRTRATVDRLSADLYLARSLAARRGSALTIRFEPSEGCAGHYEILDPGGAVLRSVTTDPRRAGVCLESNVAGPMHVNARGMLVGSPRKVRARLGGVVDSASISIVGRVYRW